MVCPHFESSMQFLSLPNSDRSSGTRKGDEVTEDMGQLP